MCVGHDTAGKLIDNLHFAFDNNVVLVVVKNVDGESAFCINSYAIRPMTIHRLKTLLAHDCVPIPVGLTKWFYLYRE